MNDTEIMIVNKSTLHNDYHFGAKGAWDSMKLLGVTNTVHKFPDCYVCAILKCAKKKSSTVSAMYAIALVDKITFEVKDVISEYPEVYLSKCALDGSMDLGPSIVETIK
jgi:hypothetical protein